MFSKEAWDVYESIPRATNVMMFSECSGYGFESIFLAEPVADAAQSDNTALDRSQLLHESSAICANISILCSAMFKLTL